MPPIATDNLLTDTDADSQSLELKIAPAPLRLVQFFVNTRANYIDHEDLEEREDLARWLQDQGVAGKGISVTESDLRWAVEVREALRALLMAKGLGEEDPVALGTVNRAVDRARMTFRFDQHGSSAVVPVAEGVDGALGRILAVAFGADPEMWRRLKVCANPDCRWAFYDRSKNRSGTWCAMAECGNVMKGRAYRKRRRAAAAAREDLWKTHGPPRALG